MAVKEVLFCDCCDKQLASGRGYELQSIAKENQVVFRDRRYQPDPAGGSDGYYPEIRIDLCYSCVSKATESLEKIAARG